MRSVLITGGSGAIGVPLVNDLLNAGVKVTVLQRAKHNSERSPFAGAVSTLTGDVTEKCCGVSVELIKEKVGTFDVFIHAAGKTQYHESQRAETYQVNKAGTEHALELAQALEIPRFVYISTAYVAGKAAYLSENEEGKVERSHNPYESSKIEAEGLVRQFLGDWLILRLSTVIGDGESGAIVNAGGYAGFVKGFWTYKKRIERYQDHPFWAPLNPMSTLNLVTNDWAVSHIRKAAASELVGTLHLTNPYPVDMDWLFRETFVRGLRLPITLDRHESEATALWNDQTWRSTQEAIMGVSSYFAPYVSRDTTFGHERVKLIPGYTSPQRITESLIARQIDHMATVLFQKKKLAVVANVR